MSARAYRKYLKEKGVSETENKTVSSIHSDSEDEEIQEEVVKTQKRPVRHINPFELLGNDEPSEQEDENESEEPEKPEETLSDDKSALEVKSENVEDTAIIGESTVLYTNYNNETSISLEESDEKASSTKLVSSASKGKKKKKGGSSSSKKISSANSLESNNMRPHTSSMDQLDDIDRDLMQISEALSGLSSGAGQTANSSFIAEGTPNSPYIKSFSQDNLSVQSCDDPYSSYEDLSNLLRVKDTKSFDPEIEMKRLFGSRVINESSMSGGRGGAGGTGRGGRDTASNARNRLIMKKIVFANPKDYWPLYAPMGLAMEFVGNSKEGSMKFQFIHRVNYAQVQRSFLDFMVLHDPNLIGQLLQSNPYHIDSLLVMSEVMKQSGDVSEAGNLIERALFAFEKAFDSSFLSNFGKVHLSYDKSENRSFFIVLFRHIQYVARKGCWKSALELSRFLLSLNPRNDPLGVLLMIDFYAVQGGNYEDCLQIYDAYQWRKRLDLLPNWRYSMAVCHFYLSSKDQGEDQTHLEQAILLFPRVMCDLIEKCGLSVSNSLKNHPYLNQSTEGNLSVLERMYVERASTLWKAPALLSWIEKSLKSALAKVDAGDSAIERGKYARQQMYSSPALPRNVYRHALISDLPGLNVSLPPEILGDGNTLHMHDPLPPSTAVRSTYDDYLEGLEAQMNSSRRLQGNPLFLFLESMIPGWTIEQALQNQGANAGSAGIERFIDIVRQNAQNLFGSEENGADNNEQPGPAT